MEAGCPPPALRRLLTALASWYREPRLNAWVLVGIAAALLLRKPHALLTPQLWAEDGSVFLLEQQQLGLGALFAPYMGYLHLIPRLTAGLVNPLLDPAWWPACYNGVAFAAWLAVIARTLSPRLPLPHKPWLALAILVGPQTGEILLNLTNAQWVAALLLVQQVIIARPVSGRERAGDLAILTVVGLTGPFIVALVPLLAWRWLRDRHRDNLAVLLVAAACAAIQALLIHRAAITFEHQQAPFHFINAITVLSRRLLIWPVLGAKAARDLPAFLQIAASAALVGAITWRALRPGPERAWRAPLLGACALLMLAGFYRMRPDTWAVDDLSFSDRYFFLPRVLLTWLVLIEIGAASSRLAWTARLVAIALFFTQLPGYRLPAPPDYRWAEHCDPIRRGVPAKIPILPEEWILHYPGRGP
jgi:hypothetical protein